MMYSYVYVSRELYRVLMTSMKNIIFKYVNDDEMEMTLQVTVNLDYLDIESFGSYGYKIKLDASLVHIMPKNLNYFCFNTEGKVVCLDTSKYMLSKDENNRWIQSNMQEIKPSKFVNIFKLYISGVDEITKEKIRNRVNESFADYIKSLYKEVEILESGDVMGIYNMPTGSDPHTLGSSCMRPESNHYCKHYAEIYNFTGSKILYILDHNKQLVSRALLWEGCSIVDRYGEITDEKITFVDRVYGNSVYEKIIHNNAEKNGWAFRRFNVNLKIPIYKGRDTNLAFNINDDFINYGMQNGSAYFDTLRHLYPKAKVISSLAGLGIGKYISFSASDGKRFTLCKDCMSPNDLHLVSINNVTAYLCNSCLRKNGYVRCDICSNLHNTDEITNIGGTMVCNHCLQKYYTKCCKCGNYHRRDVYIEGSEGTDYYCDTCTDKYLKQCKICNKWIYKNAKNTKKYSNVGSLCNECVQGYTDTCSDCGKRYLINDMYMLSAKRYCAKCFEQKASIPEDMKTDVVASVDCSIGNVTGTLITNASINTDFDLFYTGEEGMAQLNSVFEQRLQQEVIRIEQGNDHNPFD